MKPPHSSVSTSIFSTAKEKRTHQKIDETFTCSISFPKIRLLCRRLECLFAARLIEGYVIILFCLFTG
jgi:hypothetical protein